MIAACEVKLLEAKTGTKKDGQPYFTSKFLEIERNEVISAFISPELYSELQTIPKYSDCILTVNVTLGKPYFNVESVEVLKK